MKLKIFYSHKEELWNSWSHAGGIFLGVAFGAIFLYFCFSHGNGWATAGVILYLVGMLGSYIASTVYHALSAWSPWKERLRKWDHAAIYWHIAGSYSPITLIALRNQGYWGWTLFCFVWLCAIVGTIMSFHKLKAHSNLETLVYIGMGMSVLVAFKPLIDAVSRPPSSGSLQRVCAMSRVPCSIPSDITSFICTPSSTSSSSLKCMPYR